LFSSRLDGIPNTQDNLFPQIHRVLTTKIFPRQAEVISVEEWGAHNKIWQINPVLLLAHPLLFNKRD
jgi:hypothetical protein